MFKARKTDYLAIIFAILLTPLLVSRKQDVELLPMATQVRFYNSTYFKKVQAPLSVAVVNQNISDRFYEVPHILVPGYDSENEIAHVDAVAFTGLQKELIYSQRFSGLKYKSPYIKQHRLFSENQKNDIETESAWKNSSQFFSVNTGAKGRIKAMSQPLSMYRQTPQPIAGVTEDFEVFLLNKELKSLWVNNKLYSAFSTVMEKHELQLINNFKIHSTDRNVLVSVMAKTKTSDALVFIACLDLTDGSTLWTQHSFVEEGIWNQDVELIKPIMVADGKPDTNNATQVKIKSANPFLTLSQVVLLERQLGVNWQHGQVSSITVTSKMVIFKTRQFLQVLDQKTGLEIASFSIKPGILLAIGYEKSLEIQYVSDQVKNSNQELKKNQRFDVISQVLSWDKQGKLSQNLKFITPMSEQSDFVELQMTVEQISKLRPLSQPLVTPVIYKSVNKLVSCYLAPNGVLYGIDAISGRRLWRTVVTDFAPTTMNAHLSFQAIDQNSGIVVLSLGENIHIFNAENGNDIGVFTLEGVKLYDAKDNFYDDDLARVGCQILVDRLHPYSSKKTIFVVRGRQMDVIGVSDLSITLANFWERAGLLLLVTFVIALFLRIIFVVVEKSD